MIRYKLTIAYDGTDFFGWQRQPGHPTVIKTLEDCFKRVFNTEISLLGASRTDAGVHALGQVATFDCDLNISPSKMLFAWNNVLPPSILIRSLEIAPSDYNPHHHIDYKIYQYDFFQERPLPIYARYGWFYEFPVDLEKLRSCLNVFKGTHDFRSFCTGNDKEDTVRTIDQIWIEPLAHSKGYRIYVQGPRFLHHMIRRIVGACLHVASRDTLGIKELQNALDARTPAQILPNAPAHGLTLAEIVYKN